MQASRQPFGSPCCSPDSLRLHLAQQVERYALSDDDVAIYNLAGRVAARGRYRRAGDARR